MEWQRRANIICSLSMEWIKSITVLARWPKYLFSITGVCP